MSHGERVLKERVHARLLAEAGDDLTPSPVVVRARIAEHLRAEEPLLDAARFDGLLAELVHEVAGLGALEPVLADPGITEVMVNGPGRAYVERAGVLEPVARNDGNDGWDFALSDVFDSLPLGLIVEGAS